MQKGFDRFKKRFLKIRLIKSIGIGLTFGFITIGTLLLLSKYEAIPIKPIFDWLIGVGAALLIGGAVWLLLGRSDKAFAMQLDRKFGLQEKVQTMLEYGEESGTIYSLQREDAEASLGAIPEKDLRFRGLWAYITCLVLSGAFLTTACILNPQKVTPQPEPAIDPPFALTEIQRASLEELITYVRGSGMDSPYKDNIALSLTDLLDELTVADKESERDAALSSALESIFDETDDSSSAVEIVDALWNSGQENVKLLAKAVNYYGWSVGKEWDGFSNGMANFRTGFVHADAALDSPDTSKMTTETAALLLASSSGISVSLAKSGVDASDPLYAVLAKLNTADESGEDGTHLYGLGTLAALAETLGYAETQTELSATLDSMNIEIFMALEQSQTNTFTGEYAMTRISEIFGCSLPRFKRPSLINAGSGDSSADTPNGEGGNAPSVGGENVYGSTEKVLDVQSGEYAEYGPILNNPDNNYSKAAENKKADEDCTEEDRQAIEKYFDILLNGFEEE